MNQQDSIRFSPSIWIHIYFNFMWITFLISFLFQSLNTNRLLNLLPTTILQRRSIVSHSLHPTPQTVNKSNICKNNTKVSISNFCIGRTRSWHQVQVPLCAANRGIDLCSEIRRLQKYTPNATNYQSIKFIKDIKKCLNSHREKPSLLPRWD